MPSSTRCTPNGRSISTTHAKICGSPCDAIFKRKTGKCKSRRSLDSGQQIDYYMKVKQRCPGFTVETFTYCAARHLMVPLSSAATYWAQMPGDHGILLLHVVAALQVVPNSHGESLTPNPFDRYAPSFLRFHLIIAGHLSHRVKSTHNKEIHLTHVEARVAI